MNRSLATDLADRFGYERVEDDWRSVVAADDVDLVVACLPPVLNREVVLAAAAAGKHVVCEKPLAVSAVVAAEMLRRLSRARASSTASAPVTAGARRCGPSAA